MASLKEIKGRIVSVNNTLKITSAMKLVASAKLRKAQQAIGNMLPYEMGLHRILVHLMKSDSVKGYDTWTRGRDVRKAAVVCFSSNSSLCGAFNSNVVKKTLSVLSELKAQGVAKDNISVYAIGRKVSDSVRRAGWTITGDFAAMADKPSYKDMSALAQRLMDDFAAGRLDKVVLVYNHYKSTSSQIVTEETLLPLDIEGASGSFSDVKLPGAEGFSQAHDSADPASQSGDSANTYEGNTTDSGKSKYIDYEDYIVEPDPLTQVSLLLPKVLLLKAYTVLLDSNAAEHAARTVAMQTATDNGNDLLEDLTLEYNKGRQQKITNELLDLAGGFAGNAS